MADVFFQYAQKDKIIALRIMDEVKRKKISTWCDGSIYSGDNISQTVDVKLKQAKAVVFLFSSASASRMEMLSIAEFANRARTLIPVLLESCDLPYWLMQTSILDFTKWNGQFDDSAWLKLISDISIKLGVGENKIRTNSNKSKKILQQNSSKRLKIIYSTVSQIAFMINEKFYGGLHYAWCAPGVAAILPAITRNPPSSDPSHIYRQLLHDVECRDRHSNLINRNRSGIIRGAHSRFSQGIINESDKKTIEEIAMQSEISDFSPILMVIPYDNVSDIAVEVDNNNKESFQSVEYIVENLPRDKFDIWQFPI